MKPLYHPHLVNGPFGDPALYVEFLFEKRALLFDLGEIHELPARKVLRIGQVFVSHAHMDHFAGFDRLLRICLGREKVIGLFGPDGFIERVGHRLGGYTWNLVRNYTSELTLIVTEVPAEGSAPRARFRCRNAFRREDLAPAAVEDGVLLDEDALRVRTIVLDHKVPCLAFALEEKRHVNVWKNRLDALGLPTGPWLRELKAAALRGDPEERPFPVRWREDGRDVERRFTLGELKRGILQFTPGQKLGYVADAAGHENNQARIVNLVQGANQLFIEAAFLHEDRERASTKAHLTARQAGLIAREAGVRRLIPFHFSARYADREQTVRDEALAGFEGRDRDATR